MSVSRDINPGQFGAPGGPVGGSPGAPATRNLLPLDDAVGAAYRRETRTRTTTTPPRRDGEHGVQRVGLLGALVGAMAQHAGEAQGDAARVARAGLHAVEGDLDHELGPHVHRPFVARRLELEQLLGLPGRASRR